MVNLANVQNEILDYYNKDPTKEEHRLEKGAKQRLEFLITRELLKQYLPKKGKILDVGSGPGRYAIALAKLGYEVVLLDPSIKNLKLAEKLFKKNRLMAGGIILGKAEDLSGFKSGSFDAVISLGGPFSHIMEKKLRYKAAAEISRVVKRNAPVFISVMGRLSMLQFYVRRNYKEILAPYFKNWLKTGDYFGGFGFTAFHGFNQGELESLFTSNKIRKIKTVGLEGFASYPNIRKLNDMERNKKVWDIWVRTHMSVMENPTIVGVSEHMLFVGRKI
jgi:ubiquinone/menaquinone biosynthesis C-methylase UbiE